MFNFSKKENKNVPLGVSSLSVGAKLVSPEGLPFTVMSINNGVPVLQLDQAVYELGGGSYEGLEKDEFGNVKLPTTLEGFTFQKPKS